MCNGVRAAPPSASACAGLTQPRLKAVARQITSVGIHVQWLSVIWRHAACGEIKPVTRKGADKSLNHDLSVLHHPSPDPTGTVLHDFPAGASEHGQRRARGGRCLRDGGGGGGGAAADGRENEFYFSVVVVVAVERSSSCQFPAITAHSNFFSACFLSSFSSCIAQHIANSRCQRSGIQSTLASPFCIEKNASTSYSVVDFLFLP